MRFLALDIGTRRTGVAFFDDATGIPLPLDTLRHATAEELVARLRLLMDERKIEKLLIGLPLLPSGDEGSQARLVREVASMIGGDIPVVFVDERYSTPSSKETKHGVHASHFDGDAAAACALFEKAGMA